VTVTVESFDIGFVSATGALVDFYKQALGLEELEAREFPMAVVRRLACGPGVLKVMIPTDPPASPPPTGSFWEMAGIRYATLWVDDVAATVDGWRAAGGAVIMEPFELRPGTFSAMVSDPDGNVVEVMHASS
jgi:predicted enzyme related to lactoylglutathione lyase